jgi:hypothetical protein
MGGVQSRFGRCRKTKPLVPAANLSLLRILHKQFNVLAAVIMPSALDDELTVGEKEVDSDSKHTFHSISQRR